MKNLFGWFKVSGSLTVDFLFKMCYINLLFFKNALFQGKRYKAAFVLYYLS